MPEVFNSRNRKSKTTRKVVDSSSDDPVVVTNDPVDNHTFSSPVITRPVEEFSQLMSVTNVSHNPVKSFAAKPANTFFDSKDSEEKIYLLLRQHPVTQIKWLLIAVILVFVPLLLTYVNVLGFLPLRFHVVAGIAWYLMIIGYALESFLAWFFNVYIITDERVIDVDFKSLLFKNVSFAKYEKIEDVNFTTSGTLGAIFDYGTVLIQTAGATDEFEFEDVPFPSRVTEFLNDILSEVERENDGRRN
ncbi:hypothetical protein BH10PAT2_BH10PAT2_0410 [soil metagenome]